MYILNQFQMLKIIIIDNSVTEKQYKSEKVLFVK